MPLQLLARPSIAFQPGRHFAPDLVCGIVEHFQQYCFRATKRRAAANKEIIAQQPPQPGAARGGPWGLSAQCLSFLEVLCSNVLAESIEPRGAAGERAAGRAALAGLRHLHDDSRRCIDGESRLVAHGRDLHSALKQDVVSRVTREGLEVVLARLQWGKDDVAFSLHANPSQYSSAGLQRTDFLALAGVIVRSEKGHHMQGLTTAACVWVTACICCRLGQLVPCACDRASYPRRVAVPSWRSPRSSGDI